MPSGRSGMMDEAAAEPTGDAQRSNAPAPQSQPVAPAPRLAARSRRPGSRAWAEDASRKTSSLPDSTPIKGARVIAATGELKW